MNRSEAQPLTTVGEVISALKQCDVDAVVWGAWEGITMTVRVYEAANGSVIIDADEGSYQTHYQKTQCTDCSEVAAGYHNGLPYCYEHWAAHEREDNENVIHSR